MQYFIKPRIFVAQFGKEIEVDDPRFSFCTAYEINDKGICVIQQYYNPETKCTWWGPVEESMVDILYIHPNFKPYFDKHATVMNERGGYFTVPIRVLMRALEMPPLNKDIWETRF